MVFALADSGNLSLGNRNRIHNAGAVRGADKSFEATVHADGSRLRTERIERDDGVVSAENADDQKDSLRRRRSNHQRQNSIFIEFVTKLRSEHVIQLG